MLANIDKLSNKEEVELVSLLSTAIRIGQDLSIERDLLRDDALKLRQELDSIISMVSPSLIKMIKWIRGV